MPKHDKPASPDHRASNQHPASRLARLLNAFQAFRRSAAWARARAVFRWLAAVPFERGIAAPLKWIVANPLRFVSLVAAVIIVAAVVIEVRSPAITIQDITVPKELADAGFTPSIVAERLRDKMLDIKTRSLGIQILAGLGKTKSDRHYELSIDLPDPSVPGANITMSGLVSYIRELFDLPRTTISGDVIKAKFNGVVRYQFRLRVNGGSSIDQYFDRPEDMQDAIEQGTVSLIKENEPAIYVAYDYYVLKANQQDVINLIERYLDANPGNSPDQTKAIAYDTWCAALEDRGDWNGAQLKCELATKFDPNDSWTYEDYGWVWEKLGKDAKALEVYQTAAEIDDTDGWARASAAQIQIRLKNDKDAMDTINAQLSTNPLRCLPQACAKLLTLRGELEMKSKSAAASAEAAEDLMNAIEEDPGTWRAYNDLGTLYVRNGKNSDAAKVYGDLGNTQFGQSTEAEASKSFERAESLDPHSTQFEYWERIDSISLEHLGRYDDAIATAGRAIADFPGVLDYFAYMALGSALIGKAGQTTSTAEQDELLDKMCHALALTYGKLQNDQNRAKYHDVVTQMTTKFPRRAPCELGSG